MGFRFRRSFKIVPGVKFNLNKKSVGMTFGTKGAHYTVNSKGTRTKSVGIPGTGLSYVDVENPEKRSSAPHDDGQGPIGTGKGKGCGSGCLGLIILLFLISGLVSLFSGHFNVFFGVLLFISVLLAIISLFNPRLAFWTKKKTKGRAVLGYAIISIILFLAVGATSPSSQSSTSNTDSQTAATSDSSSSSDSSSQADSSVWSDASDSSDTSSSSTASSPVSSSSPTSQPAVAVTPPASSAPASSKPESQAPKPASSAHAPAPAPTPAPASLSVTGSGLNVSPGQIASVTAKGAPGAPASIEVIYSSGPSKAAGLVNKTTDGNGNVSWSWKVGTKTKPGNYPIYITIGGKQTNATLHVN